MSDNAVSLDYETFFSKKLGYTLTTTIAEQYCADPRFDPYMIAVCDGANSWSGHPRDLNWSALEGKIWLSHNRYFDNTVYNEQVKRGQVPLIQRRAWHCTANMTAYLCNRRALADAVEHLFKVKLDKSARSDANNKRWPKDFSADEQARMLKYAKGDALWCWKLWDKFSAQWPEHEREASNLTIEQAMRGVQIDTALLSQYIMRAHEMKSTTEKLLPWLADVGDDEVDTWEEYNTVPTSTKCIAEQCKRSGIPCPPVKAHEGEEAYTEWEVTYGAAHPWIPALSSWRSINKLYKTFLGVKDRLRLDGTMPFGSKYFGAHTGRVSGESRINMYNMRKLPVLANESGLMETDERRVQRAVDDRDKAGAFPGWVKYDLDFRHLILPRPGCKMIVSDASQIEPRVLAWLTGDRALLDMLRGGMSIYEAHARTKMGWRGGKLKDENPAMYALAKANVLALGYGAGWEKYIVMAYEYTRMDVTADDPEWVEEVNPFTGEVMKVSGYGQRARAIVADFRVNNALICAKNGAGIWSKLDNAFRSSVGSDFVMTLPSGRKMRYEDVRCSTRIVPNPKTGKPERKTEFTAVIGGRRKTTYGGKLTENIVQATARDVFMTHQLAMERRGWHNLFGVYDEAVLEVAQDVTAHDVEQAMSVCPDWLPGCPIGAEAKEVAHYLK